MLFAALLCSSYVRGQPCEVDALLVLSRNLESPSVMVMDKFLNSFDPSCSANTEFAEWSNELLFEILEYKPQLTLQRMAELDGKAVDHLVAEILTPVGEHPLQCIYDRVKQCPREIKLRNRILETLRKAAKAEGTALVD